MKLKFRLDKENIQEISAAIATLIAAILTALYVHSCTVNRIIRSINSDINNELKVDSVSTGINTQL